MLTVDKREECKTELIRCSTEVVDNFDITAVTLIYAKKDEGYEFRETGFGKTDNYTELTLQLEMHITGVVGVMTKADSFFVVQAAAKLTWIFFKCTMLSVWRLVTMSDKRVILE